MTLNRIVPWIRNLAVLAGVACVLEFVVSAAPETGDAVQVKRWHALYQKRAESLNATESSKMSRRTLNLVPKPLQVISNAVRPDQLHGAVYVWTAEGRPRAIGSVWSALDQMDRNQRNLCYEFHSLSDSPVTIDVLPNLQWNPREAGIHWIPLKEAPVPAKTRTLRLVQMRQLIAETRAEIDTNESELRLLTQPIYRYPTVEGIVDGAIFSFVMGTDPEVFVLLEARVPESETEPKWFLAPVRFTGAGLVLKRGDTVLWQSPVWDDFARDKIYDFLYGVEHLPAELPADATDPK